jgi:phosphinothricin acetyltransferase
MNQKPDELSSPGPDPIEIGPAAEDDLPGITEILNYAIAHSDATLTSQPVTVAERRDWFGLFSEIGPYRLLVARRGHRVLGYAASQPYREHEGFRETVEVSIALDVGSRGQGIGTALYRALFECLADEPVHVALAGIVIPNDASVALHRKLGFTEVGTFREYGQKNGHYVSSLWMQRLCRPRIPGGLGEPG